MTVENDFESKLTEAAKNYGVPDAVLAQWMNVVMEAAQMRLMVAFSPSSLVSGNPPQQSADFMAVQKAMGEVIVMKAMKLDDGGRWQINPVFLVPARDEKLEKQRKDIVAEIESLNR